MHNDNELEVITSEMVPEIPEFLFDNKKKLKFIELFEDETSITYGDIYSSAVQAGFSTAEAKVINNYHFTKTRAQKQRIKELAQNILEQRLLMNTTKKTEFGEEEDVQKLKLQQEAAIFALETLGRKDYTKKTESDTTVTHILPTPLLDGLDKK